jgi:1-deoxy-D-xylulose-5-phosphate synthase
MHELLTAVRTPDDVKSLPSADLAALAEALRSAIIGTVSLQGGHLASNLGVVELTIALLRVFSPPRDKLLFDVSHQTYAYKLLTERAERFGTLRQLDGLSGFLKRSESPYDAFGAGHAGTAISAALGFAAARDRLGHEEHVVAVVGDAAMSNGVSLEALNNVHSATRRLIVVLNDNEMSISQNVGSLARHLGRLLASPKYNRLKSSMERVGIRRLRMSWFRRHYYRIETALKSLFVQNAVFEEFGLRYIGPIDGHDLPVLQNALEIAKASDRPVLVHVATRKGRGYRFAEEHPSAWHGTPAFNMETGERKPESATPSYSQVMGESLVRLASKDERIVALTAAMGAGTGLGPFAKAFPGRFFDVGICEMHQGVFAAGLAAAGLRPLVAVYSTFLQRSIDTIIHDVAAQNLPVVYCLDRAGVVAADGPTHHGLFDLALLRAVPRLVIMQPRDERELARMLLTAFSQDAPAVIRYPRGAGPGFAASEDPEPLPLGQAEVLRRLHPTAGTPDAPRNHVALWSLGDMLPLAEATADALAAAGIEVTLVDARFVRPLDHALLRDHVADGVRLFATFENAMATGGFGSAVQEALADDGSAIPVLRVGWPDEFVTHAATNAELFERYGLTPERTAARIQAQLAAHAR